MPQYLPPVEYYATLPQHLAGAGMFLRNDAGQVLLVQPAYRNDTWEIPGGALSHGEFPWDAVLREIKEELDLAPDALDPQIPPGRLLVVDIVPAQPDGRPPLINFLFDGGRLTPATTARIQTCDDELKGWAFTTRAQWHQLLAPHLARRIDACVDAADTGTTAYLQHGRPPLADPDRT